MWNVADAYHRVIPGAPKEIKIMKSEKSELIDERMATKMNRAKKFEKRLKNKKGKKEFRISYKRKERTFNV